MNWKGEELDTFGKLNDAMLRIVNRGTREEAQEFMRQYRADSEHADSNIGYLAGYQGAEKARKILAWFDCAHPVFGTRIPSSEEALEAGRRMAAGVDPAQQGDGANG